MSTTELNRRFNNAFLHLIGTLYTHINIDAFPIGCDLLQKEFRILLSRSPLPIDCKRLVQIMALNMFIIEHTKMKSGDQEHYVSVTQNYALQLAFEMFGILVECCNNLMLSFIPNKESGSEASCMKIIITFFFLVDGVSIKKSRQIIVFTIFFLAPGISNHFQR